MIYFEANFVGKQYNLLHPRILWNSICRRGTVAVSTEATGFEGVNATLATTGEGWKPTAMPATWTLTFDSTEDISAVAIDTHTIGTSGATVVVQEWNGSTWDDVVSATPSDDEPIAFLFAPRTTDRIRLSVTGSTEPVLSVIHCSDAIEVPQTVYMGAAIPINFGLQTQFTTNMATRGAYLGRSVEHSKNQNEFAVAHLTENWVLSTLFPFIQDAREYPYFLLERPYSHPYALSYRWQDSDITPERMGIKDLMQVKL